MLRAKSRVSKELLSLSLSHPRSGFCALNLGFRRELRSSVGVVSNGRVSGRGLMEISDQDEPDKKRPHF